MPRELRRPASTADFNRLALAAPAKRLAGVWWNLRWATHAKPGHLFYATTSGRLTPLSGTIPCLYLATKPETAFYELYGDVLDAALKRRQVPVFSQHELENRVTLSATLATPVRLYDLTVEKSAQKIGMDLATLYTHEVDFPREFAQRLHDHPANFDGIRYLSRHTQSPCVVLWATHTPTLKRFVMTRGPSLWDRVAFDRKATIGTMRLFGAAIQVASASSSSRLPK